MNFIQFHKYMIQYSSEYDPRRESRPLNLFIVIFR